MTIAGHAQTIEFNPVSSTNLNTIMMRGWWMAENVVIDGDVVVMTFSTGEVMIMTWSSISKGYIEYGLYPVLYWVEKLSSWAECWVSVLNCALAAGCMWWRSSSKKYDLYPVLDRSRASREVVVAEQVKRGYVLGSSKHICETLLLNKNSLHNNNNGIE